MATDARLASLMRVVEVSYVMGARADSEESIEAFNMDVNEIEKYASIRPMTLMADSSSRDRLGSVHRTRCDSTFHSVSESKRGLLTSSITALVSSGICKYAASLHVKLEGCSGVYAPQCGLGKSDPIPLILGSDVDAVQSGIRPYPRTSRA